MLKCCGQILAWCHIPVTRWLEFEIMRLLQLISHSLIELSVAITCGSIWKCGTDPRHHVWWVSAEPSRRLHSMWPARRSPAETIKVVVIDTQRVLDQWWGWHIPWQARYYSSATVPQIVFQVLGSSWVTLKAFMSLVRVGPSVCHQLSLPAEQEEQGHTVTWTWSLLDERSVKRWKLTAKRCLTKLELLVSCLFF